MKRTETREMQILRSARKKAGFSQMQLATELDMQVRQYQRFEYGEEQIPEIPMEALREIIVNSFAHADYRGLSENEIDITPTQVEIPGVLCDD